jgi:hypothetical protein
MMIDSRFMLGLLLLLAGCGQREDNEVRSKGRNSPPGLRVQIGAAYDATLSNNVRLTFRNEESFPVCFSSHDLLPGYGTTFVRDSGGGLLNGQVNPALEDFRGINVAGPVSVLRPGQIHSEFLNLEDYRPGGMSPVIVQIGISAFRCSQLFNDNNEDVPTILIERAFNIHGNSITEYRGPRLENSQEEPPRIP